MKIIIEIPNEMTSTLEDAFDQAYRGRITQDFKSEKFKEIRIPKADWVKMKIADFIKGVLKSYKVEEAANTAREKVNSEIDNLEIKVDTK